MPEQLPPGFVCWHQPHNSTGASLPSRSHLRGLPVLLSALERETASHFAPGRPLGRVENNDDHLRVEPSRALQFFLQLNCRQSNRPCPKQELCRLAKDPSRAADRQT